MGDTDDLIARLEAVVSKATPAKCPVTLGRRPEWMGVDEYDPCVCRGSNGHGGSHHCDHGTEPNRAPGVKQTEYSVTIRTADLVALLAEVASLRERTTPRPQFVMYESAAKPGAYLYCGATLVTFMGGTAAVEWFRTEVGLELLPYSERPS